MTKINGNGGTNGGTKASSTQWTKISGGKTFHKFTDEGDSLEGIWRGVGKGNYGPVGTVAQGDNLVTFSMSAGLSELEGVDEGTTIRLVYEGQRVSARSGRTFKAFGIYVA